MSGRIGRMLIKATLVVMGVSSGAYAQASPSGPQFCPAIKDFLTPIFLDLVFPGLGRDN